MSDKKFDDWLRNKFENEHLDHKGNWDHFSKSLPNQPNSEKKNRKFTVALSIAAGLALLFASVLLFIFIKEEEAVFNQSPTEIVLNKTQTIEQTKQDESAILIEDENDKTTKLNRVTAVPPSGMSKISRTLPESIDSINEERNYVNRGLEHALPQETIISEEEGSVVSNPGIPQNNLVKSDHFRLPNHEFKDTKRTYLAIGGGVNYGTFNTGYALGFSAKQELGNKLFIDGSISMMYNNNMQNIAHIPQQIMSFHDHNPSAIKEMSSTANQSPSFLYLQFNPSIGYELSEELSISIGTDVQQLIGNENYHTETLHITDGGIRTFPTMDFGLTGKTEVKLTPHIQAGFLYREGLNNLLKSQPIPEINRRYFQVQFKYNMPIK